MTHEALCTDLTCAAPAPDEIGELISVQMTAANAQPDALIVAKTGNGNVDSSDKLIACGNKCAQPYQAGREVTLTAKAGSGSTFAGWTGACAGTLSTCTVVANCLLYVGATFSLATGSGGAGGGGGGATQVQLKVAPSKAGTVTATSAGALPVLDCGSVCSAKVTPGTVVPLMATPLAGKQFLGWGGACTGTASTCSVTVRSDLSVEATFSK